MNDIIKMRLLAASIRGQVKEIRSMVACLELTPESAEELELDLINTCDNFDAVCNAYDALFYGDAENQVKGYYEDLKNGDL